MSLKTKIISGAKWTSASSIISIGLHFLQLIILARILPPEAFGLMAMIMVVVGFSNIFSDLGVSNAIIQKENPTSNQLSSLYWLNIFGGFFIFLLIILLNPIISGFYNEPALESLMTWSALIFLITPFGQQYQILLQKELRFEKISKIEILSVISRTVSTIFFAYLGFGVLSLVWGQLISAVVKTLSLVISSWNTWHPKLRFNKNDLKGYLSFGMYQLGDRSLSYLKGNIDTILIGKILGAEALGFYNIAFNIIIVPVSKINPILTKIAFPVFSKIQKNNEKLKQGYLQLVNLLSLVNAPIFFGFALTAPLFVPLIFGAEWEKSIILVQLLAWVGLLRSIGNPVGSLLLSRGRADIGFNLSLFKIIGQVAAALIGLELGGLTGICIAYILLQLIYSYFDYTFVVKKLLGKVLINYISAIAVPIFLSLLMSLSIIFSNNLIISYSIMYQLGAQIIIGFTIYILLSVLFKNKLVFYKLSNNSKK